MSCVSWEGFSEMPPGATRVRRASTFFLYCAVREEGIFPGGMFPNRVHFFGFSHGRECTPPSRVPRSASISHCVHGFS